MNQENPNNKTSLNPKIVNFLIINEEDWQNELSSKSDHVYFQNVNWYELELNNLVLNEISNKNDLFDTNIENEIQEFLSSNMSLFDLNQYKLSKNEILEQTKSDALFLNDFKDKLLKFKWEIDLIYDEYCVLESKIRKILDSYLIFYEKKRETIIHDNPQLEKYLQQDTLDDNTVKIARGISASPMYNYSKIHPCYIYHKFLDLNPSQILSFITSLIESQIFEGVSNNSFLDNKSKLKWNGDSSSLGHIFYYLTKELTSNGKRNNLMEFNLDKFASMFYIEGMDYTKLRESIKKAYNNKNNARINKSDDKLFNIAVKSIIEDYTPKQRKSKKY